MSKIVSATPKSPFKSIHELAKTVRALKKTSQKAIDYLEKLVDDDKAEPKLRAQAAQTLIKLYIDSAKEVNADKLNRLILEVKSSGLIGAGSTADDDDTPALDFDNIHKDFRDNVVDAQNVIDMSDVNEIK